MQQRIEPPVLLSRLLMFVFAGTAVVLFVLFVTLGKMFPLDRPEVFFVTTRPANSAIIQISEMSPNAESMDNYKRAFVMEYVRARNEVERNTSFMRTKWGNDVGGVVAAWSTPEVYSAFTKTSMVTAILGSYPDFEFKCPVNILGVPRAFRDNLYTVKMRYYCADNSGQTATTDYTIRIGLTVYDNAQIQWTERLDNPLGLKVSTYTVEGGEDPLDTGYRQ